MSNRRWLDQLLALPVGARLGIAAGIIVLVIVAISILANPAVRPAPADAAPSSTVPMAPVEGEQEFYIRTYDEITGTGAAQSAPVSGAEIGLDLVLKLALVVGLIYVAAFVLRRLGYGGRAPMLGNRKIRVIETENLGPQRSLAIVEVEGRQFLIAMSGQSVQLLAELGRNRRAGDASATASERPSWDDLTGSYSEDVDPSHFWAAPGELGDADSSPRGRSASAPIRRGLMHLHNLEARLNGH